MYTARFRKIVLPIYKCPMPGGQNLIDDFEKWVNGVNIDMELEYYEPEDYQVFPGIHNAFQHGPTVCLDQEVFFKIQENGISLDVAGEPKALRLVDSKDDLSNQVLAILVGEYRKIHGVLLVKREITDIGPIMYFAFFGYTYLTGMALNAFSKYLDHGNGDFIVTLLMSFGEFDADRYVNGVPFHLDWDEACQQMHITDLGYVVISAIRDRRYRYTGSESEPIDPKKFWFEDYEAQVAYDALWRAKGLQEQIHTFLINEHQTARSRTESLKAILPDYLKTLV